MKDVEINLQEIKDKVLTFAKERDWEQFHSPKNLSMALSAEAAELMEHFLWQSADQSRLDVQQVAIRNKVAEEMLKSTLSKRLRVEVTSILNCNGLCNYYG